MRGLAIVPTFRNLRTLPRVLAGLEGGGFPVMVVDDGSDDGSAAWLDGWAASGDRRLLLRFSKNLGKGAALAAGIARARALGFEYAVSVDSDGQHLIEDALRMAEAMEPGILLLGARDEVVEGYPRRSLFGRRLWALGVRSLTGLGISDPVCGLRVYPLPESQAISVRAGRYAWEEEFLVLAAWSGIEVRELAIRTVYQSDEERVSHFVLRDWFDSFFVWARLAAIRLVGMSPKHQPKGPLACRDRSWRRIAGAAALVGCVAGAALPWFFALPLLVWVAWRLHAPLAVAVSAGLVGAAIETVWPPVVVVPFAPALAFLVTRTVRFRDSS